MDKGDDYKNPEVWVKANPGLGTIKDLEFLQDNINKSVSDPAFKATVLTKDFNIIGTASTAFLYAYITQWFGRMKTDYRLYFQSIGYDSWNSGYWVKDMEQNGFDVKKQ